MPMKILHLTDLFAPSVGGMESCVLYLARQQTRQGHHVSVVTLVRPNGVPSHRTEDIGFRVHRIAAGYTRFHWAWTSVDKPYHPPFPDPIVAKALRSIVREEMPDVVQAHNWMAYSYLAIKGPKAPPLLWTQHDYELTCPKKTLVYHRGEAACPGPALRRCVTCSAEQYGALKGTAVTLGLSASNAILHRRIDRLAGVSNAVVEATPLAASFRPDRVHVVHSFIEDDATTIASGVPRPSFLPKRDGYLLFVGALGPHKGIFDLLEAFELLGDEVPPLVVLGIPTSDSPAQWPDRVLVRENVAHAEVLAAWKHSGIAVIPSRWAEPFCLAVIEAATMGRPIVATRVGGLCDVVTDGETGLLVPPADPASIARAIRYLLANPGLAKEMGEAARLRVERLTVSNAATIYEGILADMIADHRRS